MEISAVHEGEHVHLVYDPVVDEVWVLGGPGRDAVLRRASSMVREDGVIRVGDDRFVLTEDDELEAADAFVAAVNAAPGASRFEPAPPFRPPLSGDRKSQWSGPEWFLWFAKWLVIVSTVLIVMWAGLERGFAPICFDRQCQEDIERATRLADFFLPAGIVVVVLLVLARRWVGRRRQARASVLADRPEQLVH